MISIELHSLSSPTKMVPLKMMKLLIPYVDNFEFEILNEDSRRIISWPKDVFFFAPLLGVDHLFSFADCVSIE
jgi:hypothetical protein